jgi:ribosomal protein S18 acetylase RimI-like enzyme
MIVRALGPADAPVLRGFLDAHADSSLFLRSNLRAVGIVDRGEPYHATYAAAVEAARVVAVAAHCWNGNVLLQAPVALAQVAHVAVRSSGRAVAGLSGPWRQVTAAREALGLARAPTAFESHDDLFALDLRALATPAALAAGLVHCRPTREGDLELAAAWRVGYRVELLGGVDGPALRAQAREEVERLHAERVAWMLEDAGVPVSYSMFNAHLPDVVQIGGVWTPRELRGRGYARAVVAGSLLDARAAGVARSVLFTGEDNVAAQRAYEAIGFRRIGDYGLIHFRC